MTTHDQQAVRVAITVDNAGMEAKVNELKVEVSELKTEVKTLIGLLQGKTTGSYTPADAAKELQIPRSRVYALLAQGTLAGVRIGDTWRIPVAALQELLTPEPRRPESDDGRRVLPLRR